MSYFQAYKKVLKVNLIATAIFLIVGFIANAVAERKEVDPAQAGLTPLLVYIFKLQCDLKKPKYSVSGRQTWKSKPSLTRLRLG